VSMFQIAAAVMAVVLQPGLEVGGGRGGGRSSSGGERGSGRGSGSGGSWGDGRGGWGGGRDSPATGRAPQQGMSPRLLTSYLKGATSLADLEQLEQQYGDLFDFIHISTAFNRSGHLASSAAAQSTSFRPLLQRLWRRLQPQLDACGERALANIVWACGKAGYAEAALLDACLAHLVGQAAGSKPQELANAVYSAALLQEHGYKIYKQHALQLVAALVQKWQDATPQALANTLWAAATMGLRLPLQQVLQLVAALGQKWQDADPQALANTLWAAATMGLQLPEQQVHQLMAALVQKQQDAKPQELANTLWAAATIWCACMRLQLPLQQVLQLVAALVQKQQDATPQNLSNTALALAKLGLHDAQLFAALTAAAKPKVQQFKSQELCNLCWAVAVADQQQLVEEAVVMVKQAAGSSMWSSTVAGNLQQLYQVHLWLLDVQKGSSGLAGALFPAQLQRCKEAWEESLQQRAQQRRSQLEQEVYQC